VGSNTAPELENILTYLYKTYRVDTSRVYLSGNAAGGGGVLEYVGNLLSTGVKVNVTHRIAAFVPMSAYMNAGVRPNYVDTIVNTNVHLWGFGSSAEMNGANTLGLDFLVNYAKNGYGVQTDYSGGLCCWGQFYDPNFKQNGMSIYEWCLQYSRGAAAASGLPIPGQIEAENFSAVSAGVQPQATTDAGGGVNLGWIYNGDWMDYTVNVAAAGQYKVSFRIAAPSAGNSCQLLNAAGAVLANVSLPNTGGWQTWQTVSTTVTLPAGNQVLRVKSISGSSWNFNWMQFASTTTTTANSTTAINAKALALGADSAAEMNSTLSLYPNPVQDQLNIQMNNNETGNMLVQVVDAQGGIRSVYNFSKTAGFSQVMLNTSNLPRGFYLIRITVGKISEVRKVIKM
jgi:endoglucanase